MILANCTYLLRSVCALVSIGWAAYSLTSTPRAVIVGLHVATANTQGHVQVALNKWLRGLGDFDVNEVPARPDRGPTTGELHQHALTSVPDFCTHAMSDWPTGSRTFTHPKRADPTAFEKLISEYNKALRFFGYRAPSRQHHPCPCRLVGLPPVACALGPAVHGARATPRSAAVHFGGDGRMPHAIATGFNVD